MPHLQLPPFLPMTAKANSSGSSAFPPPEDQFSNRMCKTSLPSPAPLGKNKRAIKHSSGPAAGNMVFWISSQTFWIFSDAILIVQRARADTSEPICREQEAEVPCPPRTSFCAKAVTQITDAGRIPPVCGLPVQNPILDSALRRSHPFAVGNGKSQNFHSLTPTAFTFF